MATIDLSTPAPPRTPLGVLAPLPRRLALTLAELRHVARAAGGAPLPFDVSEPGPAHSLEGRLGPSRASAEDSAYLAVRDTLHEPVESLTRRGLVDDEGRVDAGLLGAVGLLATPDRALEIDVSTQGVQVKAWHRQGGNAVATLATVDGLVFELAWFGVDQWAGELARIAALPEDHVQVPSGFPDDVCAPFSLLDSVGEALAANRPDLVHVLVGQRHGEVTSAGSALGGSEAARVITALHRQVVGRLRVLAARVRDHETTAVGVVSWVLLSDGWRSLTAAPEAHDHPGVVVRRVDPGQITHELAPVLAEVSA